MKLYAALLLILLGFLGGMAAGYLLYLSFAPAPPTTTTAAAPPRPEPVPLDRRVRADPGTLYEGLGMRLEVVVDTLTDERGCALFLDQGPVTVAIYGADELAIWATDAVRFDATARHLVRIADRTPIPLLAPSRFQDRLLPRTRADAERIVAAILDGDRLRYRYYDAPAGDRYDRELQAPNAAYAYNLGVESCDWEDLDLAGELADVTLHVDPPAAASDSADVRADATVRVVGNEALRLRREAAAYGGGCHVFLGVRGVFGRQAGEWTSEAVDPLRRQRLVVYDSTGAPVFDEPVPMNYSLSFSQGNRWSAAEAAARAAWSVGPEGAIELVPGTERLTLYGYRELWDWGVQHCGLPRIQ